MWREDPHTLLWTICLPEEQWWGPSASLQPPRGQCFIPASQRRRKGSENLRGLLITTQVWSVTRASEPDVCVLTGALGGKARPRLLPCPLPRLLPQRQTQGCWGPGIWRRAAAEGRAGAPREPPLQSESRENRVTSRAPRRWAALKQSCPPPVLPGLLPDGSRAQLLPTLPSAQHSVGLTLPQEECKSSPRPAGPRSA